MRRRTPYLKMRYFGGSHGYSIPADILRLESIEEHLDVAMKVTGGGTIKGWTVFQTKLDSLSENRKFVVSIDAGIGIIPFSASENFKEEIDLGLDGTLNKEVRTPGPHYIAIRTEGTIELPNP